MYKNYGLKILTLIFVFTNITFSTPTAFSQEESSNIQSAVEQKPTQIQQQNMPNDDTAQNTAQSSAKSIDLIPQKPAVDITNTLQENKDKNLIPVTELQGTVGKSEVPPETPLHAWLNGNYATGDYRGLRTQLENHGITFSSTYFNGDYINMSGGLKSSVHLNTIGLIDTSVSIDTQKLNLWNGGKFLLRFQNKLGLGPSLNYIGDYQGLEGYDSPSSKFNEFNEYYFEQKLITNHIKVKIGRQDANSDFCALATAQNFANASLAFPPTIPLSSYPYTNLGVSTVIKPFTDWISIKSGVFDGNRNIGIWDFNTGFNEKGNVLYMEELGATPTFKDHPGNYFLGYWLHTGSITELANNPVTFKRSNGFYLGAEQMIFKENKDPADDQGLSVFGQYGWAPPDRSMVSRYYGVGTS